MLDDAEMLQELLNVKSGMDSWTVEFIESLAARTLPLSQRQRDILEEKWQKYCNS